MVSVDQVLDCLENTLRQSSTDWRTAVLKAIGQWPIASEVVDGERYEYLLAGEAFDWKLLHSEFGLASQTRSRRTNGDRG